MSSRMFSAVVSNFQIFFSTILFLFYLFYNFISIFRLNEVLILFTVALQLCQQLKDKVGVHLFFYILVDNFIIIFCSIKCYTLPKKFNAQIIRPIFLNTNSNSNFVSNILFSVHCHKNLNLLSIAWSKSDKFIE